MDKVENPITWFLFMFFIFACFLMFPGCSSSSGNVAPAGEKPGFFSTGRSSYRKSSSPSPSPSPLDRKQESLLSGARARLGDEYDSDYYSGGYPPDGKSACVDIVNYAYLKMGVDLREKVNGDIQSSPDLYPVRRDYDINHRWCPNTIVWFRRFTVSLPVKTDEKNIKTWKAGDVVFWSMADDGVADHCGIISDKKTGNGIPLVIHQFPPECKEEDVLNRWVILGHFRK